MEDQKQPAKVTFLFLPLLFDLPLAGKINGCERKDSRFLD